MLAATSNADPNHASAAARLRDDRLRELSAGFDRRLAGLLVAQWLACVLVAWCYSPLTWIGETSAPHTHLTSAVLLGAVIVAFPVVSAWRSPGTLTTRLSVAVAQMAIGALGIHLSGGRIEAHFHVFVSLGVLTCYRDWRVLLVATAVAAVDHLARGVFWPLSVFGDANVSQWRWLEHALWVVAEVAFLVQIVFASRRDVAQAAEREVELESKFSALRTEITRLNNAVDTGDLEFRADAESFDGPYREVAEGLNSMLAIVAKPMDAVSRALEELAQHDLTARVDDEFAGQFGQLVDDLNRAGDSMLRSVNAIRESGSEVDECANEVREGSTRVGDAAEQQSAELQALAASLEEFGVSVNETATNSKHASIAAERARSSVESGRELTGALQGLVAQAAEAAEEQMAIVAQINRIASQTNLLAINASVEASHAGEAGLGFAVIAEEVSALAMESLKAVRVTSDRIEHTIDRASRSDATAKKLLAEFEALQGQVDDSEQRVAQITAANHQQESALEGINKSIERLSTLAQSNAQASEESKDLSARLDGLVDNLSESVETFRTSR